MKMIFRMAAAVGLLMGETVPASADMIFDLSGVTLNYGATLTGSFTTNDAMDTLLSANLTASAGAGSPGFNFVGHEYNYSQALPNLTMASSLPTQYFQLETTDHAFKLLIAFDPAHSLTATGATLSTNSYEYESVAGSRAVTGGQVIAHSAVPEPGTFSLLASAGASILVGGAWRRRNRLFATTA